MNDLEAMQGLCISQKEAEAKQAIFDECPWYDANELSSLLGSKSRNASDAPNKLKKKGDIFTVSHRGRDYFPSYALDKEAGFRPLPVIKQILSIFDGYRTGWEVAYWFFSENGYLEGARPQSVLTKRVKDVIRAAEADVAGVSHG